MYRLQSNTEKMLVARELEREFKDLNKYEKDNMRVWQKGISTRIDRAGTIRVVNAIPPFKPEKDKNKGLALTSADSQEELKQSSKQQKLNVFDAHDSQMLKAETLNRIGHDEMALMPAADEEDSKQDLSYSVYSSQRSESAKPKAIEYLNKGH